MTRVATQRLIHCMLAVYRLLLYVYPADFRREFGEPMAQTFADQAHEASRSSGLAGLAAAWVRTPLDLVRGAAVAYCHDAREPLFRTTAGVLLVYVATLLGTVGYAVLRFDEFYAPPAFHRLGVAGAQGHALLAAYQAALDGCFGSYRAFVAGTGAALAILLGVASGLFGVCQKSVPHAVGMLFAGAVVTVAALAPMPAIWVPFDRYAVGVLWTAAGLPVAAGASAVVTLFVRSGGSGHRRPRMSGPFAT